MKATSMNGLKGSSLLVVTLIACALSAISASAWSQELCFGEQPTIVGTTASEKIRGTDGRDVILALKGDDVIRAGAGDDLICGEWGSDRIYGQGGNDRVDGGDGDDRIHGGAGDDTLVGAWGPDRLDGGLGNDRLDGGDRDYQGFRDRAMYSSSSAPVTVDLARGRASGDDIDTDELVNLEGAVGSRHADELSGSAGPDDLVGGLGDDVIDGADGNDRIFGGERKTRKEIADGNDTLSGGPGEDQATGGYGADVIEGGAGDDALVSAAPRAANIAIESGGTLRGGGGNDVLISGFSDDTLDGGEGQDVASYRYADTAVVVDLGAQSAQGNGTDSLVSVESAVGSMFGDSLLGTETPNELDGWGGPDTIRGFGGDDLLRGFAVGVDPLVMEAGDGNDVLAITGACFGGCGPEYESNATLSGGPGDDVFNALPGGHTLDGGEGSDTAAYDFHYYADDHFVGMRIDLGSGMAWINEARCPEAQGCFIDTFVSIENAQGGLGDDLLIGNDLANVLRGLDHQDDIRGAGGDDFLFGGDGNDTLDGGPGEDSVDGGPGDNICSSAETATNC
ncbi:MAG TPA: calcium-binding protein [Actinomycetota bacterium]|nr:calcium-binding protein [Actinomycetota bacterium]